MSRLPDPGSDNNVWGAILNDYLQVEHNLDGTLKLRTDGTLSAKADEAAVVHNSGDETVAGIKNFLASPLVPTPTADNQAANKLYIDTVALNAGAVSSVAGRAGDVILGEADIANLTTDLANRPLTSAVVHTTGAETVAGVKTFSASPIVPTPTTGTQATPKAYVDSAAAANGPVTSVAGRTGVITLAEADIANLSTDLSAKATDTAVVHTTGAETVAGVKTFSASPVVPTPASGTQAANKTYVDSAVAAASGGSPTLAGDTDVLISSPTTGQVLTYDATSSKWKNQTAGSGSVTSVAGRTGAVTLAESDITNLTTDLSAKATDTAVVHMTGAETVAGVKTFSASPIIPTPTTGTQATPKAYVDSAVSGAVTLSSTNPSALGTASPGVGTTVARADHVHPTTGLMLSSQQTTLKAVNIYSAGSYPTRPNSYGSVEWIGPVDPGASAQANDTWVNTA